MTRPGRGFFTVSTERTQLFTGFADGRGFELSGLNLSEIQSNTGAATISVVCVDGKDLKSPGRILIAASGTALNQDAVFELLEGNKATLRKNWGANSPVMCEGIFANINLPVSPERIQVYSLDGAGKRLSSIPVSLENGQALIKLSPDYQTLWYEAVIK